MSDREAAECLGRWHGRHPAVYVLPSPLCRAGGLVQVVSLADPRFEADLRMTAERREFCESRRAVRLCRIRDKAPFEIDNTGDEPGEPGVVYPRRSRRMLYELAGIVAAARCKSKGKVRRTSRHQRGLTHRYRVRHGTRHQFSRAEVRQAVRRDLRLPLVTDLAAWIRAQRAKLSRDNRWPDRGYV